MLKYGGISHEERFISALLSSSLKRVGGSPLDELFTYTILKGALCYVFNHDLSYHQQVAGSLGGIELVMNLDINRTTLQESLLVVFDPDTSATLGVDVYLQFNLDSPKTRLDAVTGSATTVTFEKTLSEALEGKEDAV